MNSKDSNFSFGPIQDEYADATQRNLPKLTLALETEVDPLDRGVNPYDRDTSVKGASHTQRTDLRKLSEWIKLQKQVEAQKNAPIEEVGQHPTLPPGTSKP